MISKRREKIVLRGIGTDSKILAKRILAAKLFYHDQRNVPKVSSNLSHLEISFVGIKSTDKLLLEDVATLSLIIRLVAESGTEVTIEMPKLVNNETSRIYRFLERLGFTELFNPEDGGDAWKKKVAFKGRDHHVSRMPNDGPLAHYIPLRWISKDDFSRTNSSSIWEARPTVGPEVEKHFRSILQSHGIVDTETIDILCKTMFLELGWNALLHSGSIAGETFGAFCAQINIWHDENRRPIAPSLTFCIADFGRGIPNALRKAYREVDTASKRYHIVEGCSEETGIIRYALDPESTSRPEMPSDTDREGFRGLAFVASILQGNGNLRIRSDGGGLSLTGYAHGTEVTLNDDHQEIRIFGTQIIGEIQIRGVQAPIIENSPGRNTLDSMLISLASDFEGDAPFLNTEETAKSFIKNLKSNETTIVFDLGYADDGARSLEYLLSAAAKKFSRKWMVIWGVRTPWTQMHHLDQLVRAHCKNGMLPVLVVRSYGDSRLLGASNWDSTLAENDAADAYAWILTLVAKGDWRNEDQPGIPVHLSSQEFLWFTNEINSNYLGCGFENGRPAKADNETSKCGFYTGNIHLLKGGEPVARYFSLTQNINRARDGNLRRWVEGFYATIARLLERFPVNEESLVLIGFTATMREILAAVVSKLAHNCRAYALLTFDIPSLEEIDSKVKRGDSVLLLTDVISTGTLVEAVYGLVKKVGASVIGIACLVDSRRATSEAESVIEIGRSQVPLVTCGQIRKRADPQRYLKEMEYWVDPVSLIPSQEKAWGWSDELQRKIDITLDLVSAANAASCGHIVDGPRHSSVYVNLHKLLEGQDLPTGEQIMTVCQERMDSRGWTDFFPVIVLYPSGVSRIEALGKRTNEVTDHLTAYQTAVRLYVTQLKRKWRKLKAVEIPRAFDPSGRSRSARTIDLPATIKTPVKDVVIADDGMWRGVTVNALTQIALRIGATRILIVPLLARTSPAEVEHFELLHSVRTLDGSGFVEVCYAFPLLLPIPYYGTHECPYEITVKRLEDRGRRLPAISLVTDQAIGDLKGHTPADCPVRSPIYAATWVKMRVYVELASEHQGALEVLTRMIEKLDEPDALLAMFTLFVEEWRLLGRPRLRQTVKITLRDRVRSVVLDEASSIQVRIAATTLLRSLYRDDFVDLLPDIGRNALLHPGLLSRMVMQVATLPEDWISRNACLHFLEMVSDEGPSMLERNKINFNDQSVKFHLDLFAACKSLALEFRIRENQRGRTLRTSSMELEFILSRKHSALLHNTYTFVDMLSISGDTFNELPMESFRVFEDEWRSEHEPRITKEVLPHLSEIWRLLLRAGTQGHGLVGSELRFLENNCDGIRTCVAAISIGLEVLRSLPSGRYIAERSVSLAAADLMNCLLLEKSVVMNLLMRMKSKKLCEVVDRFAEDIKHRFKAVTLDVAIEIEYKGIDRNSSILAADDIIYSCLGNVLDNLLKYAFESGEVNAKVGLFIESSRNDDNEPMIAIWVKNNGNPINPSISMGVGGQRAAADLKMFGGHYFMPHGTDELVWNVVHRIDFLMW